MRAFAIFVSLLAATSCAGAPRADRPPLVPASTTMVTAWQVPLNPEIDATLDNSPLGSQIRWGYQLFIDTPKQAPQFTGGTMACSNCHLNAGQRERGLPVLGIAGMFPEYNARSSRLICSMAWNG